MALTKGIKEIIGVQYSCRDVIEELYMFESRSNMLVRDANRSAKIDDAIRLEILEYDEFEDELSLSVDTEEYYKQRLGQNNDAYIGVIGERLERLEHQCRNYTLRIKNNESPQLEIKQIYKILNAIPSLLQHNLHSIASNSVFAFKNEPNFEIKMINLKNSQEEILSLIEISNAVDKFLKVQQAFLKSIQNKKINSALLKVKHNSIEIESAFVKLYDDIKGYINQSIKDGEFIKKLQKLKELKDSNQLFQQTDIEEKIEKSIVIGNSIKEKRLHPDDRVHDYVDTLRKIIDGRKLEIVNNNEQMPLSYDIHETVHIDKKLFNYVKLDKEFLAQEKDLLHFLLTQDIDENRLLGVFIRMVKNFSYKYKIKENNFILYNEREYLKVFAL